MAYDRRFGTVTPRDLLDLYTQTRPIINDPDMLDAYFEQLELERAEEVYAEYGAYPDDTCRDCKHCVACYDDCGDWFRCDVTGDEFLDDEVLVVDDMDCYDFERKED